MPSNAANPFWKEYWKGIYATPRAWAHKGENLIHAFEAVVSASDENSMYLNMNDQALMLAGMAIEVQLKAILVNSPDVRAIVTTKPETAVTKTFCSVFYSHDLVKLAEIADVDMTEKQKKVADALTQFIYWRGRYVLPKENGLDVFEPVEQEDGLKQQSYRIATIDETRKLIDYIISVVKERLYADDCT